MVLAGLFLAMLELIRLGLIRAEQTRKLGDPVFLRALTDEPAANAVRNAIIAEEERAQSRPDKPKQPPIPIRQLPPKQSVPTPQRDDASADDAPISIREI